MFSWFKTRSNRAPIGQTRNNKVVRRPVQLQVEALEDRWVPSPITHVQDIGTASANAPAASLKIIAPAVSVAAGDTIFIEVGTHGNSLVSAAVADAKGNQYRQDLSFSTNNGSGIFTQDFIFSAQAVTALASGDAITVTFTGTAPYQSAATAAEFSGIAATSPLDQTQSATGTDRTPNSSPTADTTQAKELLLGAVEAFAANKPGSPLTVTFTPGANFSTFTGAESTQSFGVAYPSIQTLQVDPEFQIVAATGKYQADGTLAVSGLAYLSSAAGIATYKASDQTTQFSVTASNPNPAAGASFSVTVTAQDAAHATATGYTGTVHLTSGDGQASLPADFTFTAADKGVHTFTGLTRKTVGVQTVTAADANAAAGYKASVSVNVGTLNQKFVSRLYADLLGRPVDADGLTFWSRAADAGTDRSQIVSQIEQSPEYLGNQANKAFNLLLKRNLDDNGRSFFVKFLQGGGTDEQMLALIAGSPEYFTTRAKGDANAYVQSIFQDLLSRPLDANGQAFFTKSLSNGATRDQIATAILTSLEYRKNLVAADYQTVLRRGPDFGAVDWVVLLLQGSTDETITAGIFASSEYYNRA